MPLRIYNGSAWQNTDPQAWNGSVWTHVLSGFAYNGTSWVKFYEVVEFDNNPGTYSKLRNVDPPISFTITATRAVTWSYTKTGIGTVNVANNGTSSTLTVTSTDTSSSIHLTNVKATFGSRTYQTWDITVWAEGTSGGATVTL